MAPAIQWPGPIGRKKEVEAGAGAKVTASQILFTPFVSAVICGETDDCTDETMLYPENCQSAPFMVVKYPLLL